MLDMLSSWLEGAYLETVNQLNNTGIILNISMHLESLELAIEPKHDFQLCDLHKSPIYRMIVTPALQLTNSSVL